MELIMTITNVKSIDKLSFSFPLEKGIYAITGENGSGKSTLISCASTVFFDAPMWEYFGRPNGEASITFKLNEAKREWSYANNKWTKSNSEEKMFLSGFYEGSIIFGNRFKDTVFSNIRVLDHVQEKDLVVADDFIRTNLGLILHNNVDYYKQMFVQTEASAKGMRIKTPSYFFKTKYGTLYSQARMSTGENLLVSILHSLSLIKKKSATFKKPCPRLVLLDEVELALHSAALKRLVHFLKNVSEELDFALFFSTHSIELLHEIEPSHMYYLSKNLDGSTTVTNPCFPAFATRNLYSDDGYGNDLVILVEDDLAKSIIESVLIQKRLMTSIRIKVFPAGGWTNTIKMAFDITDSRLLLKGTKLAVVLDDDIRSLVPDFINKNKQYKGIELDFLPIKSLEKYLRDNLYLSLNQPLQLTLDSYVFQKRPLSYILSEYSTLDPQEDDSGKRLYGLIENELKSMSKTRKDLIDVLVRFIYETNPESIDRLAEYIKREQDKRN